MKFVADRRLEAIERRHENLAKEHAALVARHDSLLAAFDAFFDAVAEDMGYAAVTTVVRNKKAKKK